MKRIKCYIYTRVSTPCRWMATAGRAEGEAAQVRGVIRI